MNRSAGDRGSGRDDAIASPRVRHVVAGVAFVALACAISWPLPRSLSTHLSGGAFGDNVLFLWNAWWMRVALDSGADFFVSPYLFAPFGVDLTLHTHTALPAFAAATILGALPVLTAYNLTVLAALALNGFCAYLLAWRVTRMWSAALLGGLVFGSTAYISAHLHGHFNVISAWPIPLFALAVTTAAGSGRAGAAILAGVILGLTVYVDYYFVVYQIAFLVLWWALTGHTWQGRLRGPTVASGRIAFVLAGLAAVDMLLIVAIATTGGFVIGGEAFRLSATSTFNPLQAFWVLIAAALWCIWRPAIVVRPTPARGPALRSLVVTLGVSTAVAAPVLWHGAALWLRGEYVTQAYHWRSAPSGVDVATLVLGNPFHGVWGPFVRDLYARFDIDAIESLAWLGIVPLALAVWTVRTQWADPLVRRWTTVGACAFLWSLGPHLMAFGVNTGLILPLTVLRYIPIASNARIPGRALIVTCLAIAVLGAIGVARLRHASRLGTVGLLLLGALIFIDGLPAPFPVVEVDRPVIYETLRDLSDEGIVLELPAGTREGMGARGRGVLDHRVLVYQTIHGRPIVGGVVARLSPALHEAHETDPLLGPLLRLSEGADDVRLPGREVAGDLLSRHGIRYVVLNRETASVQLTEYVEQVLPLTVVATEGARVLYRVERRVR